MHHQHHVVTAYGLWMCTLCSLTQDLCTARETVWYVTLWSAHNHKQNPYIMPGVCSNSCSMTLQSKKFMTVVARKATSLLQLQLPWHISLPIVDGRQECWCSPSRHLSSFMVFHIDLCCIQIHSGWDVVRVSYHTCTFTARNSKLNHREFNWLICCQRAASRGTAGASKFHHWNHVSLLW